MGDEAGIEFMLPIARWRGLGRSWVWEKSFETFTQAAALGALTKRIGVFVTAHVPLVGICFGHQIIAKALGGRVGKFKGGWSVGPTDYKFGEETLTLNAWHQDQVVEKPAAATVIASALAWRMQHATSHTSHETLARH